jgi:hypothetical protein
LSSDAAWLARVLIPEGDGLATDDDADFPCSEGKIFLVGKKAQGHEQSDLYVLYTSCQSRIMRAFHSVILNYS